MIPLERKTVRAVGWAGPLLWVVTREEFSIHLYDARIELDGAALTPPDDRAMTLVGRAIASLSVEADALSIRFTPDATLRVLRADVETARIFRKGESDSHWVYRDGALSKDTD